MSEYESLRTEIIACAKAIDGYSDTAVRHLLEQSTQIDRLWADNAELRDELHAVSNRLENLTRAVTTSPAEVAERGYVRLANDLEDETSPSKWRECSECGVDIRRGASDGLIYDRDGLHTCRESERQIVAGAE